MSRTLSELQVAELRKAFSICDLDGSGTIEAKELRNVIRAITNEDPSDEEFQQIVATVDRNGDGTITWDEFLEAMTEWLAEDSTASNRKRRKLNAEQERAELHAKIKGFFKQFSPSHNFDEIRAKLQQVGSSANTSTGELVKQDQQSSQQKLEFLYQYRDAIQGIPRAVQALFSNNRFEELEGANHFAKLLAIVEIFGTPLERRAIVDDIVPLFEAMVTHNVCVRLIHQAQYVDQPAMQVAALKALTLFVPGPRIASTPPESLLHPSKMFFKKLFISNGGVPILLKLCESPVIDVISQAVLCIGALAAHTPESRDFILSNSGLQPLLNLVRGNAPALFLRNVAWTLSILCGVTHPSHSLPNYQRIEPALNALATLLFVNNQDVLRHVLVALALVLPGLAPDLTVARRLVELLGADDSDVQLMTLSAITDLVRFDQHHTQVLVKCGLLQALKSLITAKVMDVRIATCDLISVLASIRGHVQSLIESELGSIILKLVSFDENVRWKLVKVVKYITRGTPAQIGFMVASGAIPTLAKRLAEFKSYDRVLTEVYKYVGATFNFELISDALSALLNILNVGEMESEDSGGTNKYALAFGLDELDKFRSLLDTIKGSSPEDLNAWRRAHGSNSDLNVETKIKVILTKIGNAHMKANAQGQGVSHAHIVSMIEKIAADYYSEANSNSLKSSDAMTSTPAAPPAKVQTILMKFIHGEDIRVVEVSASLSFEELKRGVEAKYEQPMTISYRDAEGDLVKLSSQDELSAAFAAHLRSQEQTMKVYLSATSAMETSSETSHPVGSSEMELEGDGDISSRFAGSGPAKVAIRGGKRDRAGDQVQPTGVTSTSSNSLTLLAASGDTSNFSLALDLEQLRRQQAKSLLEDLETFTHFGQKELTQLYDWVKTNCEGGILDRKAFAKALECINITDPLVIDQNFNAFDADKSGTVDFREFAVGLSVVLKGTQDERIAFMFKAYDLDGDGFLSPLEIYYVLKNSLRAQGQVMPDNELEAIVQSTMSELDTNGDGKLDSGEFTVAVKSGRLSFLIPK